MTISIPSTPAASGRRGVDDSTDIHYLTADPEAEAPPDPWRRGFTRRRLLQGGAALGCAALGSQLITTKYAFAQDATVTADCMVVLSFRGGIDGLSCVIPRDGELRNLRPNIGVPENATQRLDDRFGLHPGLAPLKSFYDNGSLAFVHAAGSPEPNYSHFMATDINERGSQVNIPTGWVDRAMQLRSGAQPPSVFAGVSVNNSLPGSMSGPFQDIAMRSIDDFRLYGNDNGRLAGTISKLWDPLNHPATTQVRTTLGAFDTAKALSEAGYTPANGAEYPDTGMGNTLKDIARLIKGQVGLQTATCDIGGWDTHTDMGTVDNGDMAGHLTELGAALAAFATDLGPEWLAKTCLVTMSEFGRGVEQNSSGGTDHGYANCMFLLGGGIKGGAVYGAWPGLAKDALVDGRNLKATTDHRDVLGEVLMRRCGVGSLATVFPDLAYKPLGITKGR